MRLETIIGLLTFYFIVALPLLKFIGAEFLEWFIKKVPKDDKEKIKCFLGIIGLSIWTTIFICLYSIFSGGVDSAEDWRNLPQKTPNTTPIATPIVTPIPTSNPDNIFKRDMHYKGATYTGYIDGQTGVPNGKGTMVYIDKSRYEGEWADGIQCGTGKMTYGNGDVYEGEWKDGKRCGYGIYTWSDEKQYAGNYKDDMRDGEGTYTGWTGFVATYGWKGNYCGMSKGDMFEGSGIFEFDNGDKFEGIFHEDSFWNGDYVRNDGTGYSIENGKPVSAK